MGANRPKLFGLLLAVCTLGAPAPALAQTHLRLRPSVKVGVGYASDLFLGAELGPSGEVQLAPEARLDLSFGPRLKLWSEYALSLGAYQLTQSSAVDQLLRLGTRFRVGPAILELSAQGQHQQLSTAQVVDEQTGLEASRTLGAGLGPTLRVPWGPVHVEASYFFDARASRLEGGNLVTDQGHAGLLSVGLPMGPMAVTFAARATRERSSHEDFNFWGGSLHVTAGYAPNDWLLLRGGAAAHGNRFAIGHTDTFARLSLSPAVRLAASTLLEASYGYALNASSDPFYDASRHFTYVGLRFEGDLLRW